MVVVLGLGRRLNVCWKVPLSSCSLQESLQNTSGLSRKKEKSCAHSVSGRAREHDSVHTYFTYPSEPHMDGNGRPQGEEPNV